MVNTVPFSQLQKEEKVVVCMEWLERVRNGESITKIAKEEGVSQQALNQRLCNHLGRESVADALEDRYSHTAMRKETARLEAERARKFRVVPNTSQKKWTDEEMIAALKKWLDDGGSPLGDDWDKAGCKPASITFCQRLGWANAVIMAGHKPTHRQSIPRSDRVSEVEILTAVSEFFVDSNETRGSRRAYNDWARRMGKPSGQTVENRFGSWGAAKKLVIKEIGV